jgi:20S proteasome subunit beta 4
MECLIGIKCDSFSLIAHDNTAGRSVLVMKQNQDKVFHLGDHISMVLCGESGDTVYFGEFIQKNLAYYRIKHGYSLSPKAVASFTRNEMAKRLRQYPNMVNLILAGYDPNTGDSSLYFMDYLGTLADVQYTAHGYGSYFVLSTLDRYHKPDMTKEEAEDLLLRCVLEIQKRLVINLPSFSYYFIDENGTSTKGIINTEQAKIVTQEVEEMDTVFA